MLLWWNQVKLINNFRKHFESVSSVSCVVLDSDFYLFWLEFPLNKWTFSSSLPVAIASEWTDKISSIRHLSRVVPSVLFSSFHFLFISDVLCLLILPLIDNITVHFLSSSTLVLIHMTGHDSDKLEIGKFSVRTRVRVCVLIVTEWWWNEVSQGYLNKHTTHSRDEYSSFQFP